VDRPLFLINRQDRSLFLIKHQTMKMNI